MIVEFTRSFDRHFAALDREVQAKARDTINRFIDHYLNRQFPKGLRAHRCGPFLSLSVTMKHRIYVSPIKGGIRFVFVGDHEMANRYLQD